MTTGLGADEVTMSGEMSVVRGIVLCTSQGGRSNATAEWFSENGGVTVEVTSTATDEDGVIGEALVDRSHRPVGEVVSLTPGVEDDAGEYVTSIELGEVIKGSLVEPPTKLEEPESGRPYVAVPILISETAISDLIDQAMDVDNGMTSQWMEVVDVEGATGDSAEELGQCVMARGAHVIVRDQETALCYRLDREAALRGVGIMATECPTQLMAFLQAEPDSVTADTFLQCALLGRIVYE